MPDGSKCEWAEWGRVRQSESESMSTITSDDNKDDNNDDDDDGDDDALL